MSGLNVNAKTFVPSWAVPSEPTLPSTPQPTPQPTHKLSSPPKEQSSDMASITQKLDLISDDVAFANSKEHVNLVFIGHVDAGKSTMGGHLLYLTGMVDKRTMEKYEREAKEAGRESWYLSWFVFLIKGVGFKPRRTCKR